MAWPASKTTLRGYFDAINRAAAQTKAQVHDVRSRSALGPVNRRMLIDLQKRVDQFIDVLDAAIALPQADRDALIAFTQEQFGDATLDVVAEFNAMHSAAVTLRDWIHTNFPRDAGTGAVLVETVSQEGETVALQFTSAQLANFRTQADAFTATIS